MSEWISVNDQLPEPNELVRIKGYWGESTANRRVIQQGLKEFWEGCTLRVDYWMYPSEPPK